MYLVAIIAALCIATLLCLIIREINGLLYPEYDDD